MQTGFGKEDGETVAELARGLADGKADTTRLGRLLAARMAGACTWTSDCRSARLGRAVADAVVRGGASAADRATRLRRASTVSVGNVSAPPAHGGGAEAPTATLNALSLSAQARR